MMDTSSVNLMQNVYANLLAAYQSSTGSSSSILAFEAAGISLSNAMFMLPGSTTMSNDMAVEQVSELANFLPTVTNGMIATSDRSVDGFYGLLLDAQPSPGTDVNSFAAAKAAAAALFEPTLNTFELPNYPYHPIFATPPDWYDPTVTQNWTSYTSAPSAAATPPAQPAPATGTTPVLPPLHWRVLQPAIQPPIEPVNDALQQRFSAQRSIGPSILRPEMMLAPGGEASLRSPILSQAVVSAPTLSLNRFSIRGVAMLTQQQLAATAPQPVTASAPSLSFDYCFVTLQRRWLSEAFLSTPGWYVNGYAAGELSSGLQNAPPAYFDLLPCAFVVVTNVEIQADWSASDTAAMATASAIGPFSLSGQSFNPSSGTLSMTGMQIIAWVCESQPTLPPQSDPALAPSGSSPPLSGSSVGTGTAQASGASAAATTPADAPAASSASTAPAGASNAPSDTGAVATTPATTSSNASPASTTAAATQ